MERKLLVPTVVVVGVIIGMIAIVPSALADKKNDEDDDTETCKKWFYHAYKEFKKHKWIPPGIAKKAIECQDDGHESPYDLPVLNPNPEEPENPQPPVLSGLKVEFVVSEMTIPKGPSTIFTGNTHNPCSSGEIIIDSPDWTVLDVIAEVIVDMENDRTTLTVHTKNHDNIDGMVLFTTPCLGIVES